MAATVDQASGCQTFAIPYKEAAAETRREIVETKRQDSLLGGHDLLEILVIGIHTLKTILCRRMLLIQRDPREKEVIQRSTWSERVTENYDALGSRCRIVQMSIVRIVDCIYFSKCSIYWRIL